MVRARLRVDLVQATGAGEGLQALKDRIPDLILTAPLLSPFDDGVLDEYLRDLGAAGAHVQTVRIPVLSAGPKKKALATTLFSLGRKKRTSPAAPDGCDPKVFTDEIAMYLSRAADARQSVIHLTEASPHQDEAPPSPVAVDTRVMSEELVEEFTYAYTSDGNVAPARPASIEATEPSYAKPSYATAVACRDRRMSRRRMSRSPSLHNKASELWDVEATESSYVDDARNTPTPIVETVAHADPPIAPEPDRQVPRTSAIIRSGSRGDPGGLGQAGCTGNGDIFGRGGQATRHLTRRRGLDEHHRRAETRRRQPLDAPREASAGQAEDAAREGSRPEDGGV